ncbi:SDR family oxidoreductase [Flavivirga algicola]|uniref:SDR family oxidoreductase n=1 Tax=Flavivirga algicola TaxID=2729136 RepID=A0ABX1RVW2_9FLAO|nr:SDR family oxidoreductase [Flavivirga algicola]NMH87687.1 SDR family oxidoreductase [Flavivirga algicola]
MKKAIITGSSSGFGYLSTLTLARNGYKVWATMRDSNGKNSNKKKEFEELAIKENLSITVAELDITNDVSVKELSERIIKEEGNLDILINNAGIMYVGITEAYSLEQVQEQFDTNFFGVIRTSKTFLPLLKKSKDATIINISSLAGRLVFPYFGVYCASKFALEAYSEALSYELKPLGVDVSIIEPGPFPTRLLHSGPKEEDTLTLDTYGDMKTVPSAMLQNFGEFFKSEDAPNPQDIADSILEILHMEKGQRPIRKVTGIDYGTNELNKNISPIQENHIKNNLQMGHLI